MTLRFESFNKIWKDVAKVKRNRTNLLKTFSKKFQIKMSDFLYNFNDFQYFDMKMLKKKYKYV